MQWVAQDVRRDLRVQASGLLYHFGRPDMHDLLPVEARFSDWLKVQDPDSMSDVSSIQRALNSTPIGADPEIVLWWERQRQMSIELFQTFWRRVEDQAPMFDAANAIYDAWEEDGVEMHGMRHLITGEEHGIVRYVWPGGRIIEGTYKNGQSHGLFRAVLQDEVYINLFKDGCLIAYFTYDRQFQERSRFCNEPGLLDGLAAASFIPDDINPDREKSFHDEYTTGKSELDNAEASSTS
jgi:hypothetical protein